MNHLIITPVVVPLLAGILLLLLREQDVAIKRLLSLGSLIAQLGLALLLVKTVSTGDIFVYALGNWAAPFGIVLVADRLTVWMLSTTALLSIFAFIYAMHSTDKAGRHFHALFQLQLFGLNGAFLTGDLFNLFVFFEILLLASYGLLLHGGGRLRTKAGLHFVVINLAGSTLFLFAVGTLYGILGTLNMADLALKVASVPPENLPLVRAAGLLLFGVFALKAALLPLYLWLPAAYAHTSAPVAALFAIMTKVGAYCILRIYTLIYAEQAGPAANLIESWLLPLALATLMVGVLGAVGSRHLRLQTAYLVIASVGTLLIAFGLNSQAGIATGLYYLPHTTFASAALFLLADAIARRRGEMADRLDPGPVIASPRLFGGLFMITAILMAGLPPLSGFLGKFMLLRAALDHPALPWVMAVVLISGLLALIALARTGSLLFYRVHAASADNQSSNVDKPCFNELAPIVGLLGLCLVLTIWAEPVLQYTNSTALQLLQPYHYIHAVLGGRI
ncbi:monovalent cation/H+ antiporter subunit D [Methylotenera sp.]|uniref:monovalent cation/H+ antiporter subunit D n=1 Tax=Methylotenera sp. TaxID=2051956 RepID=UPI0027210521|nr:monovalent cation/H+ antiporter subunit D [Methylotenera sp.]MDO9206219.1 monovalent cation/H+ antiporter subunit D [Methylotenera sp.]MDP2230210.1 monovalent cation/H+ antiporter subunit D [Methylotenera sp.]MDP3142080.1 monovalent cation/H+ antiporter subunit D [Methylotenera sp.]MDP3308797.1 monovalent cation/H+ antiporter subunit D [Methylotenera sp.]MDP3818796.1 monovalent cation/H+ antiporter subunit D [Methylotenera sp.]